VEIAPPAARPLRRFGLEPNVVAMLATFLALGMGEELWVRFVPKYLELLGAGAAGIAIYGALRDLLDAVYPYPGGWLADRWGRRTALSVCALAAIAGYLICGIAPSWPWVLVGTVLAMAWSGLTLPAIFAVIGDHLPPGSRATGFGVQAILKRLPIIVAPPLGGWLIARYGLGLGVRAGIAVTIVLAFLGLWVIRRFFTEAARPPADLHGLGGLWREMAPGLKRLLIADVLARWAEGIPKVFIVLWVIDELGASSARFGALTALQMVTSTLAYLPLARLADRLDRKPFVLATFAFFALFPLALVALPAVLGALGLGAAFVVGGLREVGEPARKALIVDLAPSGARGRAVGLYYLVRGLAVFPAPLVGGWLWSLDRRQPFWVAGAVGIVGFLCHSLWGPSGAPHTPERSTS